jgi:hypothetical protein
LIKQTITYENPFDGKTVTEEHYFHISKADLVKMELESSQEVYVARESGEELTGARAMLQRVIDSEDGREIMTVLEDFIRRSYGIKDGEKFRKSEQIWDDFASSEAYSQLFFELTTDAEKGAAFINGIIPQNLDQIAAEVAAAAERERMAEALKTKDPSVEPATGTEQPSDPLPPDEPAAAVEEPLASPTTGDAVGR